MTRSACKFRKQFYGPHRRDVVLSARHVNFLLTAEDLVNVMSDQAEKSRRFKGTEHWMPIDPKAPRQ
jgi:hypothetical protein